MSTLFTEITVTLYSFVQFIDRICAIPCIFTAQAGKGFTPEIIEGNRLTGSGEIISEGNLTPAEERKFLFGNFSSPDKL